MVTRLNWDYFGGCRPSGNRLLFKRPADSLGGLNGPSYITPDDDFVAQNMTGTVEATGNQVRYSGIETGCGVTVDAAFTVEGDRITLELEQTAERGITVIEGEAWRLLWNMRAGMTGVAAVPTEGEGRNGYVELPALITADEGGCLAVRLLEGDGALHTESYRQFEARSLGFIPGISGTGDAQLEIPRGKRRAVYELSPRTLLPVPAARESTLSEGVRRCWAAGFTAFRPEFGGFSNNAVSTNCHV